MFIHTVKDICVDRGINLCLYTVKDIRVDRGLSIDVYW